MDIKEFADKFIEAEHQVMQQGNFDALEQIESPDIVFHMAPPLPDLVGFEAHKQYLVSALEMVSEISQEYDYITGDGNIAVLSCIQKMTTKVEHPVLKIPAGSKITADAFFVLRRENDKIAEIFTHSNMTID